MKQKQLIKTILSSLFLLTLNTQAQATPTQNFTPIISKETQVLSHKAPNINPKVLKLALTAYSHARKMGLDNKKILTVIDYKLPDTSKRLWVFDLTSNRLLYNTFVAHGQGSGDLYAHHFSNSVGSHASSIGVYLTQSPYYGSKGLSLRLLGLDRGFNDNAFKRAFVVHGAWYVSAHFADQYGRIGRSWGCPSVSKDMVKPVINSIKGGTLVFAYAPNYSWLNESKFLNA